VSASLLSLLCDMTPSRSRPRWLGFLLIVVLVARYRTEQDGLTSVPNARRTSIALFDVADTAKCRTATGCSGAVAIGGTGGNGGNSGTVYGDGDGDGDANGGTADTEVFLAVVVLLGLRSPDLIQSPTRRTVIGPRLWLR